MTLTSDSPASVVASRALSLALGQDGGGSGESWEAASISHGADLAINAEGFTFDTRSHSSQLHYQEGDQIWLSGVLQTSVESGVADGAEIASSTAYPYFFPEGVLADRSDVIANSNMSYDLGEATNALFYPAGQGGLPPIAKTTNRAYISWFTKQSTDINLIRRADFTSISGGPFETGGKFGFGESITLTTAEGLVGSGRLIWVDTDLNQIFFEYDNAGQPGWGTGNLEAPATIQGETSGAVASLNGNAGAASSTKRQRFETEGGTPVEARFTVGNTVVFDTLAEEYLPGGYRVAPTPRATEWQFSASSLVAEGNSITGTIRTGTSEQIIGPHDLGQTVDQLSAGFNLGPHVNDYAGFGHEAHQFKTCNLVYDDLPARVMLGNGATWQECTDFADCLIKSWSPARAVVRQNHANFAPTDLIAYYVFDNNDQRISDTGVVIRPAG